MTSKTTKQVTLTTEFSRAAAVEPENSLAFMLMSAFGITLSKCVDVVDKMVLAKDNKMIVFCLTAAVQIRGNVVYVGPQYANVKQEYPDLVIEGTREQKDIFNFGACHICGHILANMSGAPLGKQILQKAGNCIEGGAFPDNDAGSINKQINASFTADDKDYYNKWSEEKYAVYSVTVDAVLIAIPQMSASFAESVKGKPTKPVPLAASSKAKPPPAVDASGKPL
jgi:hypothetical protein